MTNLFDLTGKRALVTGGTHGLGMAMARGLGEAGAELVINGHTPDRLERAVEIYRSEGYLVTGSLFDVTDESAVRQAVDSFEKKTGPIDILVNNAGIIRRTPLLEMSPSEYREVLDVDLTGPFIVTQAVVSQMIRRKQGKVINICSMMSELGRDNVGAYAAAKGGLKMLTRSMATEWARHNIQVNGIGPGYFATEQTKPIRTEGHPLHEFILKRTPAGRWGTPDDLKGAAVFLASAASNFVNGHILYVDGGILATIGRPDDPRH
ncbi:MAG: gluconate 5-dehydrogenase [Balneolaceae bacterium]